MDLLKACCVFYKLATQNKSRFENAAKFYSKKTGINLTPGPAGTKGQIFFSEKDPNIVIKFTTDSSEAFNMNIVRKIQNGEFKLGDKVSGKKLSKKDITVINNNIIKIYKVTKLSPPKGPSVFAIEQERGSDLPFSTANTLMLYIGSNISRQPKEVFKILSEELSDKAVILEITNSLIEGNEVGISNNISKVDMGNVLKTVRKVIDSDFRDFRPSNMVVGKNGKFYTIKLIDIGYGTEPSYEELKELEDND